jgi:myo-inositol 2-dehydrogenase/D-chiro-inositol 1-dehydrogenase
MEHISLLRGREYFDAGQQPMNILILGDGPDEQAWARHLAIDPGHRLWAAYPALKAYPTLPGGRDLDDALATAGVEAVIVGGEPDFRAEALRRVAAAGLPALCLHPPGLNADPYYQIALSHQETGAIVVPGMPSRLHPGVEPIREALSRGTLGAYREVRYEMPVGPADGELALGPFARIVDVVRHVVGEIESVTGTGDPPGGPPTESLVVQLRGPAGRRAEVRLATALDEPARLVAVGEQGSIALEHQSGLAGPSRLIYKAAGEAEVVRELEPWDAKAAILGVLDLAVRGGEAHPDLRDGTRAMELAEATVRSLRRGRTIDLVYEEMSEAGNFKSVMTGVGCGLLVLLLFVVPLALAGPALGVAWLVYVAWVIPPVLVGFLILQLLRLAIRK